MAIEISIWTVLATAVVLIAITPTIMGFFGRNRFQVDGKTVLITGGSQGMGKSVAIQLAKKGASIVIVAREIQKLESALEEVKISASSSSQRFHYISADLSNPDATTQVLKEVTAWNNGRAPDIVWCIAGASFPYLFIETPLEKLRSMMDLNYWSAAYMAHATLSSWLAANSPNKGTERHFIFTSSVAALYPIIGYAPYTPTKAAIRGLSDTLASEVLLYGEDVQIHTVCPGTILSPSFADEQKIKPEITLQIEKTDPQSSPDEVASRAIKGLENGEYLINTNILGQFMRAQSWSGAKKNNWLWDSFVSFMAILLYPFIRWDLDRQIKNYGKEHGHPETFRKKVDV